MFEIQLPLSYGRLQHFVRDLYRHHQRDHDPVIREFLWRKLILSYDEIENLLTDSQQPVDNTFIKMVLDLLNARARRLWIWNELTPIEQAEKDPIIERLGEFNYLELSNALSGQKALLKTALDKTEVTIKDLEIMFGKWAKTVMTDDGKIQPMLYAKLSA